MTNDGRGMGGGNYVRRRARAAWAGVAKDGARGGGAGGNRHLWETLKPEREARAKGERGRRARKRVD